MQFLVSFWHVSITVQKEIFKIMGAHKGPVIRKVTKLKKKEVWSKNKNWFFSTLHVVKINWVIEAVKEKPLHNMWLYSTADNQRIIVRSPIQMRPFKIFSRKKEAIKEIKPKTSMKTRITLRLWNPSFNFFFQIPEVSSLTSLMATWGCLVFRWKIFWVYWSPY